MFASGEWRLGTDALRALDKNYYADPRMYPSMLYLFGLMDHEHFPEDAFEYYEDEGKQQKDEQDIVIEDEYDNEQDKKDWDKTEEEI